MDWQEGAQIEIEMNKEVVKSSRPAKPAGTARQQGKGGCDSRAKSRNVRLGEAVMSISCHRQISDEKKRENRRTTTAQLNTSARPVLHVTGETGTSWEHGSSARSCQLFCPSLPPPLSRPIHPQHGAWSMRWRGTDRPTDLLTDDNPALSGRGERAHCGPHHTLARPVAEQSH